MSLMFPISFLGVSSPEQRHYETAKCLYLKSKNSFEESSVGFSLEGNEQFVFAIDSEGDPVAFMSYNVLSEHEHEHHVIYLHCLYVLPEYQGKGIGSSLLKQLSGHVVLVACHEENERALSLYKRFGAFIKHF